jgi:hypothetical protein
VFSALVRVNPGNIHPHTFTCVGEDVTLSQTENEEDADRIENHILAATNFLIFK